MLSPSAPPRWKIEMMMSRLDEKFFAMTIFGSHAGNSAAADTPALVARNWRRDSSLYSWQPQSRSCSVIVSSGSVPLEGVGAERELDRLAHPCVVERAGGDVIRERRLRRRRDLAAEEVVVDHVDRSGSRA